MFDFLTYETDDSWNNNLFTDVIDFAVEHPIVTAVAGLSTLYAFSSMPASFIIGSSALVLGSLIYRVSSSDYYTSLENDDSIA